MTCVAVLSRVKDANDFCSNELHCVPFLACSNNLAALNLNERTEYLLLLSGMFTVLRFAKVKGMWCQQGSDTVLPHLP